MHAVTESSLRTRIAEWNERAAILRNNHTTRDYERAQVYALCATQLTDILTIEEAMSANKDSNLAGSERRS